MQKALAVFILQRDGIMASNYGHFHWERAYDNQNLQGLGTICGIKISCVKSIMMDEQLISIQMGTALCGGRRIVCPGFTKRGCTVIPDVTAIYGGRSFGRPEKRISSCACVLYRRKPPRG